jgi:hypothetical protein
MHKHSCESKQPAGRFKPGKSIVARPAEEYFDVGKSYAAVFKHLSPQNQFSFLQQINNVQTHMVLVDRESLHYLDEIHNCLALLDANFEDLSEEAAMGKLAHPDSANVIIVTNKTESQLINLKSNYKLVTYLETSVELSESLKSFLHTLDIPTFKSQDLADDTYVRSKFMNYVVAYN